MNMEVEPSFVPQRMVLRVWSWVSQILFALFTLLLIIWFTLFTLEMARGSVWDEALRYSFRASGSYLGNLIHGDWGSSTSFRGGKVAVPVREILPTMLGNSLGLLGIALGLALLLGVVIGYIWARRRHSALFSVVSITLSLAGISLPAFFLAMLLQLAVIHANREWGLRTFPVAGYGWDTRLILPSLVLAARPLAQISRVTGLALSELLEQDYVRMARAKGLSAGRIFWRHVLPLAAMPILTSLVSSLRFSLASLPVVELFFGWPGVGYNLLRAIARGDDALVVGLVLSLGALFIVIDGLLRALISRLDPRLSASATRLVMTRQTVWETLRQWGEDILAGIRESMLVRWLMRRVARGDAGHKTEPTRELGGLIRRKGADDADPGGEAAHQRLRRWRWAISGNVPLWIGTVILLGLTAVVIWGPSLAPHSPYQHVSLRLIEGRFQGPPFPPSEEFPWGTDVLGRDVMSLVLVGAGRTLTLALAITAARVLVGLLLGMIAGWNAGGPADRLIRATAEIIAAYPSLILAMLLILALGIRRGLIVFVVALTVVGWGEVMLFVRGQVQSLRPMAFIESAVALGLRIPRVWLSHILPNLASSLIALAALEMGGTMLLLAELGFVGIFLNGGATAELFPDMPPYLYSDVPEWASMLSNVRLYARSYPWTAIYPAVAFFLTIWGFNLFGEGLRVFLEHVRFSFTRVLNRYTLAGILLVVLAVTWARENIGPWRFFREYAGAFQAERARGDIAFLADEAMQGRRLDSPQLTMAAEYIADQFAAAGLNTAGENLTYFSQRYRQFASYQSPPSLSLSWDGTTWQALVPYQDFAPYPSLFFRSGELGGEVVFVAGGGLQGERVGSGPLRFPLLEKAGLRRSVLMVREEDFLESPLGDWSMVTGTGVLVIAEDDSRLRTYLLPSAAEGPGRWPVFWISREVASRILAHAGRDLSELSRRAESLGAGELLVIPTGVLAQGTLDLVKHERVPVQDVIALWPGASPQEDQNLILVMAPYDGLGVGPSGEVFAGANGGASGVAVMLEILRSWKEMGYEPAKSVMFAAFVQGGYPYGQAPEQPLNPLDLVTARPAHANAWNVEAIIYLDALAGPASGLQVHTAGYERQAKLFQRAGRSVGVPVHLYAGEWKLEALFSASSPYARQRRLFAPPNVPILWVYSQGSEGVVGTMDDTLANINIQALEQAGKALSMALMTMASAHMY